VTTAPLLAADWPVSTVSTVATVLGLLLAAVTGVLALLDRRLPDWVLWIVGLLEVALVVLTVQAVVAWIGGNAPADPVVFLAYLVVVLLAGPGTVWWGSGEPGRWGAGVVCVAGLLIPVLLVRLQQVWTGAATATGHG
jgi:hypothetical protein